MPSKRLEYEEPRPLTRADVEQALSGGQTEEIERALVAVALHEQDVEWAAAVMIRAAGGTDSAVRGTAILCFGHLARIHGRIPSSDIVVELVRAGLTDPDDYVRGQAHNAADDIEMFVPELKRKLRSR
jgi:hypothetical protein